MRFLVRGLLLAIFCCSAAFPVYSQNAVQSGDTQSKDQFFTGTVTGIDDTTLTVIRTVLGKNSSTKTFQLNSGTRFEGGRPTVRAQVTVRYITTDEGDRATHVILRRAAK